MSGSYQRPAADPEPITAQWSPGFYHAPAPHQAQPPYDEEYYAPPAPTFPTTSYANSPYPTAYYGMPTYQGGASGTTHPIDDPWAPAGGDGGWGQWPPPPGPWAPPPPPKRSRVGLIAGVLAIVLLLMVAATGVVVGLGRVLRPTASATGTRAGNAPMAAGPSAAAPGSGGGSATLDSNSIAARVDRFVVDINTLLGFQSGRAAGTGIVISGSGLVLTNNHVVAGSTSISVTEVSNGRTFTGTVVGYNRTEDVAVVQMRNASGLPTASIGDSSRVRVGDAVLGIGNAGGAGGTPAVAPGTVSALNQSITATDEGTGSSEQLTGLIQVDANIQAGDSGGPLVNNTGQVIGIDTAASVGFRYQASGGTGFAIPINQALDIAHQIIAGQASSKIHIGATGFLGVQVGTGDNGGGPGAPVVGVVSGSPAAAAGLGAGAVINSVNGQAVTSANQLTELLDNRHPGDRVRVGWTDQGGQDHNSSIRLIKGPVG